MARTVRAGNTDFMVVKTTHGDDCDDCNRMAYAAAVDAAVTGSVGATHSLQGDGLPTHSAEVGRVSAATYLSFGDKNLIVSGLDKLYREALASAEKYGLTETRKYLCDPKAVRDLIDRISAKAV